MAYKMRGTPFKRNFSPFKATTAELLQADAMRKKSNSETYDNVDEVNRAAVRNNSELSGAEKTEARQNIRTNARAINKQVMLDARNQTFKNAKARSKWILKEKASRRNVDLPVEETVEEEPTSTKVNTKTRTLRPKVDAAGKPTETEAEFNARMNALNEKGGTQYTAGKTSKGKTLAKVGETTISSRSSFAPDKPKMTSTEDIDNRSNQGWTIS